MYNAFGIIHRTGKTKSVPSSDEMHTEIKQTGVLPFQQETESTTKILNTLALCAKSKVKDVSWCTYCLCRNLSRYLNKKPAYQSDNYLLQGIVISDQLIA